MLWTISLQITQVQTENSLGNAKKIWSGLRDMSVRSLIHNYWWMETNFCGQLNVEYNSSRVYHLVSEILINWSKWFQKYHSKCTSLDWDMGSWVALSPYIFGNTFCGKKKLKHFKISFSPPSKFTILMIFTSLVAQYNYPSWNLPADVGSNVFPHTRQTTLISELQWIIWKKIFLVYK